MKRVFALLIALIGLIKLLSNKSPKIEYSPLWMEVISQTNDRLTVALYEGQTLIDMFCGDYQQVEQNIWDRYGLEIEWVNVDEH